MHMHVRIHAHIHIRVRIRIHIHIHIHIHICQRSSSVSKNGNTHTDKHLLCSTVHGEFVSDWDTKSDFGRKACLMFGHAPFAPSALSAPLRPRNAKSRLRGCFSEFREVRSCCSLVALFPLASVQALIVHHKHPRTDTEIEEAQAANPELKWAACTRQKWRHPWKARSVQAAGPTPAASEQQDLG